MIDCYALLREAIYGWLDLPPALQLGVPLVTLVGASLLLVALKRVSGLPRWLQRVVDPPFYLVSLPLATLIVGTELLAWVAPAVHHLALVPSSLMLTPLYFLIGSSYDPIAACTIANCLVAPFAVFFSSIFMLWRTLGRRKEGEPFVTQKRMVLFLVIVFAWGFLTLSEFLFQASGPR